MHFCLCGLRISGAKTAERFLGPSATVMFRPCSARAQPVAGASNTEETLCAKRTQFVVCAQCTADWTGSFRGHGVAEENILVPDEEFSARDNRMWPTALGRSIRLVKAAVLDVALRGSFDKRQRSFPIFPAQTQSTIGVTNRAFPEFLSFLPNSLASFEVLTGPAFTIRVAI